jgi:hypothetical protein
LLADAGEFFEGHLWEADTAGPGRDALKKRGLDEKAVRPFGVGYAPVRHGALLEHLEELGYSEDEFVDAGLARRSARGRIHEQFRSRIMFPIRDREGRAIGFAGLATHVGPSWPLWVVTPDTELYHRNGAVFGLDRAKRSIGSSREVHVRPDCMEVLIAHKEGQKNAVCVHTGELTQDQLDTLGEGVRGGVESLELELPEGMRIEPERDEGPAETHAPKRTTSAPAPPVSHAAPKRIAIVAAIAFLAVSAWTTAPLFAVWVGAQVQGGEVLSIWGVLSVLVVFGVLVFLIAWALTWLSAKYDELTGRPRIALETSPWHRAKRGDRVQDIRSRFGISLPERIVAASVILAVLALQVWFFLFAGAPF